MGVTLLELWLLIVGLVSAGGTAWSLIDAVRQRARLIAERSVNGRTVLSNARLVRELMRWVASSAILVGALHLLMYEADLSKPAIVAKTILAICGTAMTVTLGVDAYCRKNVRHR
jgi:hypothetical protein